MMSKIKVLKFGGTSVGAPDRMRQVARLISADDQPKIVVLSALSGTTNSLVSIGDSWKVMKPIEVEQKIETLYDHYLNFINDLLSKERDAGKSVVDYHFDQVRKLTAVSYNRSSNRELLAQGELMSTKLFTLYLKEISKDALLVPALEVVSTDEDGEPDIELIADRLHNIIKSATNQTLFITQGYICRNHLGEIDNLKRGGSDYTASLLGAAMRAESVEIWTDIDGMHNNDPRIVPDTYPLEALSFDEAAELAYFGAKILHPNTIWPAQKYNIPVKLLNTMAPQAKGTVVSSARTPGSIKAIAAKDGIIAIKIKSSRMLLAYGFMRKIFEIFEQFKVPIDMITTSEVAVSLTIDDDEHLEAVVNSLKNYGDVAIDKDMSIVCIVGDLISEELGLIKKVLRSIGDQPVRMISYGGSRNNISILIPTRSKKEVLLSLNQGLFKTEEIATENS
jgi:aspartate kinase